MVNVLLHFANTFLMRFSNYVLQRHCQPLAVRPAVYFRGPAQCHSIRRIGRQAVSYYIGSYLDLISEVAAAWDSELAAVVKQPNK